MNTANSNLMPAPDQQLLDLLAEDPRMPTGIIAQRLGVTPPTARRRLQRLLASDRVYLGPVVDIYAAGYHFVLIVGIQTDSACTREIARTLSQLPGALTVNIVHGEYDIELAIALRDRESLSSLLLVPYRPHKVSGEYRHRWRWMYGNSSEKASPINPSHPGKAWVLMNSTSKLLTACVLMPGKAIVASLHRSAW